MRKFAYLFSIVYLCIITQVGITFVLSTSGQANVVEYSAEVNSAQIVKVLTLNFNSEMVPADQKYVLRNLRLEALTEWVKEKDPDIILIQEGWNTSQDASVIRSLAKAIDYDYTYTIGMGSPIFVHDKQWTKIYDSNGILAKKKFRMTERKEVKLPHSAFHIGDRRKWILVFGRVSYAVGAKLELENGKPIFVYTSHLIAHGKKKADQLFAMKKAVRNHLESDGVKWEESNVVLGGDFNLDPDSPEIKTVLADGYQDTWAVAHPSDPGLTIQGDPYLPNFNPIEIGAGQFPTMDKKGTPGRIDLIFSKSPQQKVLASTIQFTVPYKGVWMSNHYGLFSTVSFGSGENPSGQYPNPVRDYEGPTLSPVIMTVDEKSFENRELSLPSSEVGPRGFVVVNSSPWSLKVNLRGPGPIFTRSYVTLAPSRMSAFAFYSSGNYLVEIDRSFNLSGPSTLFGQLNVSLP